MTATAIMASTPAVLTAHGPTTNPFAKHGILLVISDHVYDYRKRWVMEGKKEGRKQGRKERRKAKRIVPDKEDTLETES